MRAVVYDDFGVSPELRDVPAPSPPPTGVVLDVRASGLCRSDWHGWRGHDSTIDPPHVPGHEMAGIVAEVGSRVERWAPGDRVTLPFVGGCGRCEHCAAGHPQVCPQQFQPGFTAWGSFAERVAIEYADTNLVRLPDGLGMVDAASLGCRFGTAFRAIVDQGGVSAGDWVAVHGCGGVGLSAVMIAEAVGARVVAVDVVEETLEKAEKVGAAVTIDANHVSDVAAEIRARTGGGVHVSLDALGDPETCFQSVACLRKRGCHVQVGLLVGEDRHASVPFDRVVADELELRGVHGIPAPRYSALLGMVEAGMLAPGTLVERTISLAEVGPALVDFDGRSAPGIDVVDSFA